MDPKERKRIERVISEALSRVEAGEDEFKAALDALAGSPSYVYRELAVAAVVSTVRTRRRSATLVVERSAIVSKDNWETALTPSAAGVRKGTASYDRWLTETENGRKYADEEHEYNRRKWSALSDALDRYTKELRVQWTAELLSSEFALADGTRVTWGEATREQHIERRDIFMRNASANLEGAARHQQAIDALEGNAATLNDLVQVAA